MALIHNILLRGLNCIYLQAPNVKKPEDIADFIVFCDAWPCTLHSHHKTEETVYFPLLEEQCEEKGVMARNHAEHEVFLPGLLAFDKYLSSVKADVKSYDGKRAIQLIEDFGPALETHLRSEIELLEGLAKDDHIDWDLLGKTMAQHSKKVADRAGLPVICLKVAELISITRFERSLS
jgi:hemerythrin-like domain-containing protein